MQLGTALNLPNPRINFGGTGRAPGKGNTAIFSFETGVLDSRINFSRTTNATVTNSAGQITYAPHNLLTYSEQFDNAVYTKKDITVLANQAIAPNGTLTSDRITPNTTNTTHYVFAPSVSSLSSGVYSIYVKADGYSKIALRESATAGSYASFNLSTGTVIETANVAPGSVSNANIENVGNGWYRISALFSGTANQLMGIWPLPNSYTTGAPTATWSGDGTSGLFIWGAQLEVGTSPTTYNSTTVKNLLGYSELFDNAAWTKSNSFVQTNLLTFSEAFDNAAWSKTNGTSTSPVVTANNAIAPNGYQTADSISFGVIDAAGDFSVITQAITLASTANHTRSVYVKATTVSDVGKKLYFYVTDGVLKDVVTITLTSEWQRVTKTLSMAAGAAKSFTLGTLGSTYGGENQGVVSADVWGFQVVQGDVAGDYRRTDAAALPVYYPNHNGVVCAEKLVDNTVNAAHSIQQSVNLITNTPYTVSCYGKKGELSYLWIRVNDTTANQWAWFNLNTGVVGTVNAGITANITSVGNGYYRCSVTRTSAGTGAGSFYVGVSNADNITAYTGDGTSGIYIFGAQLSDSASLDPYVLNATAAPTAAAYYGARFDYDPVTLLPKGLLIEEQRINYLLQSEDYTQAIWIKDEGTISSNATTAPDGNITADLFIPSVNNVTSHRVRQTSSSPISVNSFSVFVKYAGYSWAKVRVANSYCNFNISTGAIGNSSNGSGVIQALANGWYRCTIITSVATGGNPVVYVYPDVTDNAGLDTSSYAGDGTSGIYVWGAQLEAASFATSYIPTAASQVTRAADIATIQGSNFYSWYNQDVGSIYSIADTYLPAANSMIVSTGSTTGAPQTYFKSSSTYSGGLNSVFEVLSGTVTANTYLKGIFAYKAADYAISTNGATVVTSANTTVPALSSAFTLGNRAGTVYLNGHIKQISYYPQRLSNDVLKGLTA